MDADSRVRRLLDELLDSEQTPEAVCRDCPELLSEVRERWRRKLACDAELDAMFPTPECSSPLGGPPETPFSGNVHRDSRS